MSTHILTVLDNPINTLKKLQRLSISYRLDSGFMCQFAVIFTGYLYDYSNSICQLLFQNSNYSLLGLMTWAEVVNRFPNFFYFLYSCYTFNHSAVRCYYNLRLFIYLMNFQAGYYKKGLVNIYESRWIACDNPNNDWRKLMMSSRIGKARYERCMKYIYGTFSFCSQNC